MTLMQLSALFLALITAIGWLNVRLFKLPPSVAMLSAGVVGALVLLTAQTFIGPFWGFNAVQTMVKKLDFSQAVLGYMLAFLLFASGLQVDLAEVRKRRIAVWTLATFGVILSTALVGVGVWAAAWALGTPLPLAWALTFGALISPTDPIAVLSAMKSGAVSPRLGAILQGEALFNDGVGFVAFTTALAFAVSGAAPHPLHTAGLVLLEAGGGLVLGLISARMMVFAFRGLHDHVLAVTATLTLSVGVYVLADLFHLSGPIAAASAGLIVGSDSVKARMSDRTRYHVEGFWETVDQVLNAVLFLLLGLQVFVLPFDPREMGLWAAAVGLSALARFLVVVPWGAFFHFRHAERGASLVLTWGGLRGAVSLALALSLPHGPYRSVLLGVTFVVVIFSVVIQGLTFGPLAARLSKLTEARD